MSKTNVTPFAREARPIEAPAVEGIPLQDLYLSDMNPRQEADPTLAHEVDEPVALRENEFDLRVPPPASATRSRGFAHGRAKRAGATRSTSARKEMSGMPLSATKSPAGPETAPATSSGTPPAATPSPPCS